MSKPEYVGWVASPKHDLGMCQSKRCTRRAVANMLCAVHDAWWISNGQQPPRPDYGLDATRAASAEVEEAEGLARASVRAVSSIPLDNAAQLQQLADEAEIARLGAETLRERLRENAHAHLEAIRQLEKKHAKAIAEFEKAAAIAERRLAQAPAALTVRP